MKGATQDKEKEVGKQSEREPDSEAAMITRPKPSSKFSSCLAARAGRHARYYRVFTFQLKEAVNSQTFCSEEDISRRCRRATAKAHL